MNEDDSAAAPGMTAARREPASTAVGYHAVLYIAAKQNVTTTVQHRPASCITVVRHNEKSGEEVASG